MSLGATGALVVSAADRKDVPRKAVRRNRAGWRLHPRRSTARRPCPDPSALTRGVGASSPTVLRGSLTSGERSNGVRARSLAARRTGSGPASIAGCWVLADEPLPRTSTPPRFSPAPRSELERSGCGPIVWLMDSPAAPLGSDRRDGPVPAEACPSRPWWTSSRDGVLVDRAHRRVASRRHTRRRRGGVERIRRAVRTVRRRSSASIRRLTLDRAGPLNGQTSRSDTCSRVGHASDPLADELSLELARCTSSGRCERLMAETPPDNVDHHTPLVQNTGQPPGCPLRHRAANRNHSDLADSEPSFLPPCRR